MQIPRRLQICIACLELAYIFHVIIICNHHLSIVGLYHTFNVTSEANIILHFSDNCFRYFVKTTWLNQRVRWILWSAQWLQYPRGELSRLHAEPGKQLSNSFCPDKTNYWHRLPSLCLFDMVCFDDLVWYHWHAGEVTRRAYFNCSAHNAFAKIQLAWGSWADASLKDLFTPFLFHVRKWQCARPRKRNRVRPLVAPAVQAAVEFHILREAEIKNKLRITPTTKTQSGRTLWPK